MMKALLTKLEDEITKESCSPQLHKWLAERLGESCAPNRTTINAVIAHYRKALESRPLNPIDEAHDPDDVCAGIGAALTHLGFGVRVLLFEHAERRGVQVGLVVDANDGEIFIDCATFEIKVKS